MDLTAGSDADIVTIESAAVQITGKTPAGYNNFDILSVSTGAGEDEVTIVGTHLGATTVDTGTDNDTVTVEATSGELNVITGENDDSVNVQSIGAAASIDAGAGADTVNVGDANGVLTGIGALLGIIGGDGTDTLNVDNDWRYGIE